ncbi:hypothetical protein EV356DRAFT_280506 [Viridothelium virens]|uniref:Uncharacterized protein n=1 Tax=Viridothelium virens TaxID=1048519 RepID=A0A6A6H1W8_VIRVR|nr:hypothetical protein EV356DRAFT_280506 [Viridothelium virens]
MLPSSPPLCGAVLLIASNMHLHPFYPISSISSTNGSKIFQSLITVYASPRDSFPLGDSFPLVPSSLARLPFHPNPLLEFAYSCHYSCSHCHCRLQIVQ